MKWRNREIEIEVEGVQHEGRPAVRLGMAGPFKLNLTLTLQDAETISEMLVTAVRMAEEADN